MLDRLLSRFRDEMEVAADAAAEAFRAERADEIDGIREDVDRIRAAVEEAMDDLDAELAAFAGYDDPQGRDRIEDVVDNVAAERRRMIDDLDLPDDPGDLHDAIDGFVDDFVEMTQKESMILDAIGDAKRPVFDALDAV
ncbi:MAG: hypothetical protein ABEK12_01100, partial [Candidatus Nanohaloarchaea archaeon]